MGVYQRNTFVSRAGYESLKAWEHTSGSETPGTAVVAFAGDINPLLAEAFLEEAPVHAARFTDAIARLAGGAPSMDDVVQAQRVAHALKGSANITGVSAITDLTHDAEDVLDWLARNQTLPPPGLREVLLETANCVSGMVDALRQGGAAPPGSSTVRERLCAWRAGAPAQGFDPLELDEYNELHGKTIALAGAMTDFCEMALGIRPELARLDDTIADQQRIGKELIDAVLSARMVPVGSIGPRLQRTVRETCRATGKQAVLEITGGSIPVDGDILNALVDPLLRVPLTLISMHVLLVRSAGRIYGVPSAMLERVLFSAAGRLDGDGPQRLFSIDEREYRVRAMDELAGHASDQGAQPAVLPLLLLEADSGPTAVAVDAAVDGRHLVVKSLGSWVPRPAGVIGASILGDGSVAPVLDLRELLRHRTALRAAVDAGAGGEDLCAAAAAPEVLVVDDSLTDRRMLSIALGDAGYRVRTAIDGIDAVEAIEDGVPDLVVTDLEMPRMNGLELAAHLRADPRTGAIPLLMVTSRSTQKHRAQAEARGIGGFITKPYSNGALLEKVQHLLG